MRHLLAAMFCSLLACSPSPRAPSNVSAAELVDHFKLTPRSTEYVNRPIKVRVPRASYKCDGRTVSYFTGLPDTPAVIVFHCDAEQPPANCDLLISGVCLGITQDGVRKADKIHFTVRLSECSVQPLGSE